MTTIDEAARLDQPIAAGTIPLHPGVEDYRDAKGKVILWVKDTDQGRSIYMGIETYGDIPCVVEVRYDDFADVVTRMMGTVTMSDSNDPFNELLNQEA